jgi:Family of unknown function (DUF5906)
MIESSTELQELYKNGYCFDLNAETFLTKDVTTFVNPKGFEDWKVQLFDFDKYAYDRMQQLGVTEESNTILLRQDDLSSKKPITNKIFTPSKKGGLEITKYSLHGYLFQYVKDGTPESTKANIKLSYDVYTRNASWQCQFMPKSHIGNPKNLNPFWHKNLLENFASKTEQDYLVLTEGYIKGWKASEHNIPTCGLTSTTTYKESGTSHIHSEIVEYLTACKVKKLIILWDGDCREISPKAVAINEDLATRPNGFYSAACKIRTLLKDYKQFKKLKFYFAEINTKEIDQHPKGIDDLLIQEPNYIDRIKSEFENIGELNGKWINWIDISEDTGIKKFRKFMNLATVYDFYAAHKHQNLKTFKFQRDVYEVVNDVPVMTIPQDLMKYLFVGTDVYKLQNQPLPAGDDKLVYEEVLDPWTKDMITMNHGKDAVKKIVQYKGFTNIPSNLNFSKVVDGYWNLYHELDHQPEPGEWIHIEKLLKHIFQEHYEMALDYLTLLYRKPSQKLPIVALVSEENKTGKSTYVYLVKLLLKNNMAIISNAELTDQFNSQYASKTMIACEETLMEKSEGYEKLKNWTTAKTIMRNEKNKAAKDVPCNIHLTLCSNHPKTFMRISKHDSRFWIRQVPTRTENIKNFDDKIANEINYFVHFLLNRTIKYEDVGERLYFSEKHFQTTAFHELVANSEIGIIKELKYNLVEDFTKFDVNEIRMNTDDLCMYYRLKGDRNWISKAILSETKSTRTEKVCRYSFWIDDDTTETGMRMTPSKSGRPFVFLKSDFVL